MVTDTMVITRVEDVTWVQIIMMVMTRIAVMS